MMCQKMKYLIIISFIFFMTIGLPFSNGTSSEYIRSPEDIAKVSTKPEALEIERQNGAIVSGTIPKKQGMEAIEWFNQLDVVSEKIAVDGLLKKYEFIDGFGPHVDGYIQVSICMNCTTPEENISEIIEIFQEEGKKQGIENIPIVAKFVEQATNATTPSEPKDMSGFSIWQPVFALILIMVVVKFKN
ncbi:hypothetical protein MsAg5_15860 [Methanosarcinaceae archaeon Ag5]|uniref:Uncharacterized protein n=2 Tax=Methanolapillus africanus TaxID=3028297 RepID=A0AAE4MJD9_9EURY|nr:hypothetical protein [Methanosarcinaceae archaeon Ag5]